MKVLHICESYAPDYGGGGAVYAADICRLLARRGHDVRVLTTESGESADYSVRSDVNAGLIVRRVTLNDFVLRDPEGWSLGLLRYRRHEARIDAIIRDEVAAWRPDVVHYHTTRPFGEQALFTLKSLGLPVVAMAHEAWLICMRLMLLRSPQSTACPGPTRVRCVTCIYTHYDGTSAGAAKLPWRILRQGSLPFYRLRRREAARRYPSIVIAYSKFMTEVLRKHLSSVRYVPLGVTHPAVLAPRPERPRKPLRFGFFGGGQPTKGLADVLVAARDLTGRGFALDLRIWGTDEQRIRGLVDTYSAQEFAQFRGSYSPETMWAAYAEVDIAVMATRVVEPFGRIPQEAALAGIPSLVPRVGGLTEQIRDGIDGLLFDFLDVAGLTLQMERLLADPGLYSRLASNLWQVRDTVEAVDEIETAYRDLLDRKISELSGGAWSEKGQSPPSPTRKTS